MIESISHVGVAVWDIDEALTFWRDVLGLQVVERFEVVEEGVRTAVLSASGDKTGGKIELIQPINPRATEFPIVRRLTEVGEGMFHIAVRADTAEIAQQALRAADRRHLLADAAGPEPQLRVIVHPRSANGVLVEILTNTNGLD